MKNAITAAIALGLTAASASAQLSIDPNAQFAWGENIGWVNFGARDADSVQVFSDHLAGFAWGENVGNINLGNGNGPYANTDNTNFGVNIDPDGTLSGFAWGENIGWINFDTSDDATRVNNGENARYDSATGQFSGYIWGENVGWIVLEDGAASVSAIIVDSDLDCDGNGIVNISDLFAYINAFTAQP